MNFEITEISDFSGKWGKDCYKGDLNDKVSEK